MRLIERPYRTVYWFIITGQNERGVLDFLFLRNGRYWNTQEEAEAHLAELLAVQQPDGCRPLCVAPIEVQEHAWV